MRTIKEFINNEKKVYFYLKDEAICKRFFADARAEGLSFGGEDPTKKEWSDIIALLPSGELCYVGWAGRVCYHNAKSAGALRIDYAAYLSGSDAFLF